MKECSVFLAVRVPEVMSPIAVETTEDRIHPPSPGFRETLLSLYIFGAVNRDATLKRCV